MNDFEAIAIQVIDSANQAPIVTNPGNKTVNELVNLAFTVAATDPNGDPITFTLGGAPAGATIGASTGAFSWTPTEAQGAGTYTVTITASDNRTPPLSGSAAITITVNEVNVTPVLAAIGNKTVTEMALLAFTGLLMLGGSIVVWDVASAVSRAARLVGSSQANLFTSISGGINALWGPLHGGANQAVLEMLEKIRQSGGDVQEFVKKVKDREDGVKLMGFGHRVYKNYDPRAKIIKKACDEVFEVTGVNPLLKIAQEDGHCLGLVDENSPNYDPINHAHHSLHQYVPMSAFDQGFVDTIGHTVGSLTPRSIMYPYVFTGGADDPRMMHEGYEWNQLFTVDQGLPYITAADGPMLEVTGTLTPADVYTASWGAIANAVAPLIPSEAPGSPYALVLRRADGSEITRYPFDVDFEGTHGGETDPRRRNREPGLFGQGHAPAVMR
jgi:hypothetical protein